MKSFVNFSDFCDGFQGDRKDTFSYNGKKALYEYLQEYEESIGEEIEFDPIALCCEYTEYDDAIEAASEYFEFEGMKFDDEGGELETREEVEKKAIEFLQDRTMVIEFEGGIIIGQF